MYSVGSYRAISNISNGQVVKVQSDYDGSVVVDSIKGINYIANNQAFTAGVVNNSTCCEVGSNKVFIAYTTGTNPQKNVSFRMGTLTAYETITWGAELVAVTGVAAISSLKCVYLAHVDRILLTYVEGLNLMCRLGVPSYGGNSVAWFTAEQIGTPFEAITSAHVEYDSVREGILFIVHNNGTTAIELHSYSATTTTLTAVDFTTVQVLGLTGTNTLYDSIYSKELGCTHFTYKRTTPGPVSSTYTKKVTLDAGLLITVTDFIAQDIGASYINITHDTYNKFVIVLSNTNLTTNRKLLFYNESGTLIYTYVFTFLDASNFNTLHYNDIEGIVHATGLNINLRQVTFKITTTLSGTEIDYIKYTTGNLAVPPNSTYSGHSLCNYHYAARLLYLNGPYSNLLICEDRPLKYGVAMSTVTSGNTVNVYFMCTSSVYTGPWVLVEGTNYYLDIYGGLSIGSNEYPVGIAINSSALLFY